MEKATPQLIDRMRASGRPELLMLLAKVIVEVTIQGRSHYDDENANGYLRQINEAIHRLAGHLRDLSRQEEIFTESRAAGIGEQLVLLYPDAIARILSS